MPRGALLLLLAASAAERDCRGELCGLRPYLWTMMASTPTTLTLSDHFVDHYAALGVDPARMRAVVDDGPAADALRASLARRGVSVAAAAARYSSATRTALLNDWLRTLPGDAWALAPDVDEFFEYDDVGARVAAGEDRFVGRMVDRVGADLTFPEASAGRALGEQFPGECRGLRGRAWVIKQTLFRVADADGATRQFWGAHDHSPEGPKAHKRLERAARAGRETFHDRAVPGFAHYAFVGGRGGFFGLLQRKIAIYAGEGEAADGGHRGVYESLRTHFDEARFNATGEVALTAEGRRFFESKCERWEPPPRRRLAKRPVHDYVRTKEDLEEIAALDQELRDLGVWLQQDHPYFPPPVSARQYASRARTNTRVLGVCWALAAAAFVYLARRPLPEAPPPRREAPPASSVLGDVATVAFVLLAFAAIPPGWYYK